VKCKKVKNDENLVYSTQLHQRTCNFHQINTLKCTNVESKVKLNTKKVVILHEHTLRDVYTTRLLYFIDDALLKAMTVIP